MSHFGGKFEEIPEIAVDNFTKSTHDSDVFFLSHCHTDHMRGLDDIEFQSRLIADKKFIYTSAISCAILMQMYPRIKSNLIPLELRPPTIVPLRDNKLVTVTPISAAHCPGSVMFLFETTNKRILFTGDYRLNPNDLRALYGFYDSLKQLKRIDNVYLDTTFFSKSYPRFPTRDESLREICRLIKEWIEKSKEHIVNLVSPAKYGYEFLFKEIHAHFGMPVHLSREVCDFYTLIPELDGAVTSDGDSTQIHSSCGTTWKSICKCEADAELTRTIKASAAKWRNHRFEEGVSDFSKNYYFVCYSTHASYEEGVGLLKFLKPKKVTPFVRPFDGDELEALISDVVSSYANEGEDKVKLFQITEEPERVEDNEEICDWLESPPRKRKF